MLLSAFLLLSLFPLSASAAKDVRYGLTLKDGEVYLNGKPFYCMGVNYYDPFLVYLRNNKDMQKNVEKEFKTLADSGIPAIRASMCGYAPNEFGEWAEYPDYYFKHLDTVVALAEKYRIGIIFDLAWYIDAIPEYAWEIRSDIGDVNSETMRLSKEYVKDVVTRYKDSPAVWVWEIGNEYNLAADLDGVLNVENKHAVSSMDIHIYYEELAKMIRDIDPYRLITGGDSEPRNSAYNLYHNDSWQQDTRRRWPGRGEHPRYRSPPRRPGPRENYEWPWRLQTAAPAGSGARHHPPVRKGAASGQPGAPAAAKTPHRTVSRRR